MTPLSGHPNHVYNTAWTTCFFLSSSFLLLLGGHLLYVSLVFCFMTQLLPGQSYPCPFDSSQLLTTNSAYLSDLPWYYYCQCGSGNTNLLLGHQHLRKVLDSSKATLRQSFPVCSPSMGSKNSVVFLKDNSPISNIRWHLPPYRLTHIELSVIASKLTGRK